MMKRVYVGFSAIILLVVSAVGISADDKKVAAEQAAMQWLSLVDSEQYDESWEEASSRFQNQISSSDWAEALTAARKPFGSLVNRELVSATHTTSVPGAPDGDYVVLHFQTEFESTSQAVETITPMLEEGQWKVSGYYIK